MDAVLKQPVVTAAEAFSETLASLIKSTREILAALAMATKYEIPEGGPPDSTVEVASKSPPNREVPELAIETQQNLSPAVEAVRPLLQLWAELKLRLSDRTLPESLLLACLETEESWEAPDVFMLERRGLRNAVTDGE
ncbi:hypothetical protein G5714_023331 [Onychostoma macrolepis]|uniref:Uncharacterized protein n=1 Tax=Onychostoma macrolepis TaxID=369639 RepID=A0A7J6BKX4_9TELE|nr:hypothetical protein G5714_023331 [Onychostoma macrolepis]